MKTRFLILLLILTLGTLQIQESFSEDYFSTSSCHKGVSANDHIQCSTGDFPPCQELAFEKNGYCKNSEFVDRDWARDDGCSE